MSKISYKSKILQHAPANDQVSGRNLDKQEGVGPSSNRSNNQPRVILYLPKLAALLGNVYAVIFLQQVYYHFKNKGNLPFYKFLAPCLSEYYRQGDSWVEELSFTYRQLNRATGTVATKISSTRKKAGSNKNQILSIDHVELDTYGKMSNPNALVLYWTHRDRRTW